MSRVRYVDIAVNLTDSMFNGVYNTKQYHLNDLEHVIKRCKMFNIEKLLVTGSSLSESENVIEICKTYPEMCYATVGVHPCCVNEINEQNEATYLNNLSNLIQNNLKYVRAFGEIGLDYDRLHYSSKEQQQKYFKKQLDLATSFKLPLFLHMRNANDDFINILKPYLPQLPKGVVHSFTGTIPELRQLLSLGLYIGINGCSLKTAENLETIKQIPLNRLMIETDSPWCEIRPSHAGYKYLTPYPNEFYPKLAEEDEIKLEKPNKLLPFNSIKKEKFKQIDNSLIKGRNEPVNIGHVAQIVSKLLEIPAEELTEICYQNSVNLFNLNSK